MSTESVIKSSRELMDKAIGHLESELLKIRTGKAQPSMLDSVMVDYYGAMTPLNQIANVNTPDARTLVVQPWEKSRLADIERAIINSNLGLNPQNDGEVIRINVPPLTEERRKEMVKMAKNEAEHCKISIRNARKNGNESIKKLQKDGLAEDLAKDAENSEDVWKKVQEELEEFKQEVAKENNHEKLENEFGDLIFSLINYARFIGINPEDALEKTNKKFRKRFQYIEAKAGENGRQLQDMTLEEMDVYWEEAKKL